MTKPVITVNKLSKAYKIGLREQHGKSFREALTGTLTAPFRRMQRLASGSDASSSAGDETFWALKDISFEVQRSEVVGIIGRNGAGKSTLLKVLSRITEPTSGEVRLRGRVASLLEVGTGFHPELTGRENIYLNGAILGMKKAEIDRKFDEIVAFAEIEKFLDTAVKRYSSGMYVRLAFAVAAHLEPEILIVDEVLAVGDAEFQKKCLGKMQEVSKGEGRTVLFVSHNMAAIKALCSCGIVLNAGGVVFNGAANAATDHYNQPMTQADDSTDCAAGPFTIHQVSIRSSGISPVATFTPLQVTVDLSVTAECHRAGVNLYIESTTGDLLAGITGVDLQTVPIKDERTRCQFVFAVEQLPLLQGTYYLVVETVDQGRWHAWRPTRRWPFSVDPAIIYGTRTSDPLCHGMIGLKCSLRIQSSTANEQ